MAHRQINQADQGQAVAGRPLQANLILDAEATGSSESQH